MVEAFFKRFIFINDCNVANLVKLMKPANSVFN